jgi:hypothetical protein
LRAQGINRQAGLQARTCSAHSSDARSA